MHVGSKQRIMRMAVLHHFFQQGFPQTLSPMVLESRNSFKLNELIFFPKSTCRNDSAVNFQNKIIAEAFEFIDFQFLRDTLLDNKDLSTDRQSFPVFNRLIGNLQGSSLFFKLQRHPVTFPDGFILISILIP